MKHLAYGWKDPLARAPRIDEWDECESDREREAMDIPEALDIPSESEMVAAVWLALLWWAA